MGALRTPCISQITSFGKLCESYACVALMKRTNNPASMKTAILTNELVSIYPVRILAARKSP